MLNKDEIIFVVDKDNKPLEPKPRHFVHENNLWHRTTGIWVVNSQKRVLCQKRSLNKDVRPGYWEAFFGGHLLAGEEFINSAVNELKEELDIAVSASDVVPYKIFKSENSTHKEFQQVFFLFTDLEIGKLKYEKDEIDQLKWLSLEELKKILVVQKSRRWVIKPWDEEVLGWLIKRTRPST